MKRFLLFLLISFQMWILGATAEAQVPSYVPTNGLVGWWPFNGNANDESGNGNNGTVNGATLTTDRFGNSNHAYIFNGVSDYIQTTCPGILGNKSRTLSAWINCNQIIGENTIMYYGSNTSANGGTDRFLCLVKSQSGYSLGTDNDGSLISYNASINLSSWHNVIWVYDSSATSNLYSVKIYLDGSLLTTINYNYVPFPAAANINTMFTDFLKIGVGVSPQSNFNGKIDDIGMWDYGFTAAQVQSFYASSQAAVPNPCLPSYVPTNGLVGWWPFCGNANDESGNGNHGTPMNGVALSSDRNGNANSAYSFDGVDDYVVVPNSFSFQTNVWTINAWFKTSFLGYNRITSKDSYATPTNDFSLIVLNGNLYLSSSVNGATNNPLPLCGTFVADNYWHNVVAMRSNGFYYIYMDGVFCTTVADNFGNLVNSNPLYIGSPSPFPSQYFNGKLDDIGIWNRVLTPAEIQALYLSGQPCPSIANIHGPSNVNVGSTITLMDSTANGTWSSSNTAVATINTSGVVTGVTAGTITISYISNLTCGPDTATYTITVNPNPCLPSYVPTNGLLGWWPFCGNANDESGNGNNGTTMNGVALTSDRNGNGNSAYYFDGVDDTIRIPVQQSNVLTYSVAAWVKTVDGGPIVSGRGLNNQIGLTLHMHSNKTAIPHNGKFMFVADGPPGTIGKITTDTFNNNAWHHVVGVFNGTNGAILPNYFEIYVDGLFISQWPTNTNSANCPVNNGTDILFGAHQIWPNGGGVFKGQLDDIGIWNRALTPAEIQALYLSGQPCTVTHTTTRNLCHRDSTLWNGKYYSMPGTDTVHLTSIHGCDSVDVLNLNVYPLYYTVVTRYFCKGSNFVYNGQTISTAGTYYFHLTSATGCDSTVRLRALNYLASSSKVSMPICSGSNVVYGGQTFSSAGVYLVHLTNYVGCDSAVTLSLVKRYKSSSILTRYKCLSDSLYYQGKYYKQSGTYTVMLTNYVGCDSTVTLRVLNYPSKTTYVTKYICAGSNYVYNNTTYTSAGIYLVKLKSIYNCDSVIQLTLVKAPVNYTIITKYRCPNDSLLYNGVYYKTNGIYTIRLANKYGCDSIITMNLLTAPTTSSILTRYICQGDSLLYHGVYYKQTGTYFIHLTNHFACDSTVRLRLLYNNSSSLTTVTLCHAQTFTWNGTTYTWAMAGTYVRHFTNYKGCDSTATLKIYKGNCKGEGVAIGTTITTTENVNDETATPTALEAAHNFEMSIYPNPNTGRFTLENNCTTCKQMQVEIMSLDGKLLYSQNADNSTGKINIDLNLTPGMYWVKMSNVNEGFSEVRKFVIEN